MKLRNLFKVAAGIFLAALAPIAQAQVAPLKAFSTGNQIGTTLASAIISANGIGIPRVQYISATADNATNKLIIYAPATGVLVTGAAAISQAVIPCVGTSFSANDIFVARHVATDVYQRLIVSASTATNVTATANLTTALAAGDLIYKETITGLIPVGSATKEVLANSGSCWNGTWGSPTLIDLTGAAACTLGTVSGIYEKP